MIQIFYRFAERYDIDWNVYNCRIWEHHEYKNKTTYFSFKLWDFISKIDYIYLKDMFWNTNIFRDIRLKSVLKCQN